MSYSTLKETLISFLKGEENIFYPVVETRILQLSPLQITDDYEKYLEINSLEEDIRDQIDDIPGASYKLILNKWEFVFRRVPNSHEYYFDIIADSYRIVEADNILELDDFPNKIIEDSEVKYYFEARKRREIEDLLKRNMRIKRTPRKTPTKTAYSEVPNFDTRSGKVSPAYNSVLGFATSRQGLSRMGTTSPFKTYPEGAKSRRQEILTIYELLDLAVLSLPSHLPSVLHSQVTSMNVTPTKEFMQKSEIFDGIGENPYLGKRSFEVYEPVSYDDVREGILEKKIKWGELVFDKKCLEYLKNNRKLLKRNRG